MNKIFLGNLQTRVVEGTFVADTSEVVSGDVVTDTLALALTDSVHPDSAVLRGRVTAFRLLDEDDRGAQLDIVLMKSNVSLGTKNSAVSISDADAREIIGDFRLTTYLDLVNSQQATGDFVPIPFELATQFLYLSVIARGTATYTASGLRFQLGYELHNQVIDL